MMNVIYIISECFILITFLKITYWKYDLINCETIHTYNKTIINKDVYTLGKTKLPLGKTKLVLG